MLVLLALALGCGVAPAPSPPPATALPPDAIEVVVVPSRPPANTREFEDQRQTIHAALRARVQQLTEAGTFQCCIKIPCTHCALMAGGCNCGPGLQNGEPVCHDCALMWQRGQGIIAGVDPKDVCSFLEAERSMNEGGGRCFPGGDPKAAPAAGH